MIHTALIKKAYKLQHKEDCHVEYDISQLSTLKVL
jgi:hypothetical protein